MNPSPAGQPDVEETRIALAFSGGVALAIYESGVAYEFFRLVSDPAYAELRSRVGPIIVDVITGASAGGLNGAFLANALVNEGNMRQLMHLWRDKAGMDELLYGPNQENPQSLLDGDYFFTQIYEALQAPGRQGVVQNTVDLYITGTNLNGHPIPFRAADGEKIDTLTHRQVFRFQYRDDPDDPANSKNDFGGDVNCERLAQAARTTASFPFAFAPFLIQKNFMGAIAQNLGEMAQAYHIDGGVLDNKPIGLAVQAIDERPARKRVTRKLFYIEPDPQAIHVAPTQDNPRPYSPTEVVYQALIALPGYQSITNALQDIEQRNKRVLERRRLVGFYESMGKRYRKYIAGCDERHPVRSIKNDIVLQLHPHDHHSAFKYVGPERFDSAFYRAMEDGYLDLRLERAVSQEIADGFKAILAALKIPLQQEAGETKEPAAESQDGKRQRDPWTDEEAKRQAGNWPLRERVYKLKSLIVAHLDLQYYLRYYDFLMAAVQKQYPPRPSGTGSGADDMTFYTDVADSLNHLVKHCCDQSESIRRLVRATTARTAEAVEYIVGNLRAALQEIVAATQSPDKAHVKKNLEELAKLLDTLLARIEKMPLQEQRCELFNNMRRADWRKLQEVVLGVLHKHKSRKRDPDKDRRKAHKKVRADLIDGYWELRDAMESFYMRDVMLYPMMQGTEIQTELEVIHFARISPLNTEVFLPGLTPSEKLAGEVFLHFGGFFLKSWRGNDLVWGRLDAAEIIVRNLLPAEQWDSIGVPLVQSLQKEILREMAVDDMTIYNGSGTKTADLIGKQTLAHVPEADKARWVGIGSLTMAKMVRNCLAGTDLGKYFPRIIQYLDTGIIWGANIARFVNWLASKISKQCLQLIAAIVVATGVGFAVWACWCLGCLNCR